MSHMVNSKENITNLKDSETRVTVGYIRTLTGKKRVDWNGYKRCNGKLYHVTLTNTDVIPDRHSNLFILTQELQKGFQVMSEGDILIPKINLTDICFEKTMPKKYGKGFLPTTKIYKRENCTDLEGKSAVQTEGTTVKKQEINTTKKLTTRKMHAKEIHANMNSTG